MSLMTRIAKQLDEKEITWVPSDVTKEIGGLCQELNGLLTDEMGDRLVSAFDGDIDKLADDVALYIKQQELEVESAKAKLAELKAIVGAVENTTESLREFMKARLKVAHREEAGGVRGKVTLHKNTRPAISFEGDAEKLPDSIKKVVVSLDSTKAHSLWKAGKLPKVEGLKAELGDHVKVK